MAGTTWLKSEITRAGGITACARHLGVSTTAVEHWYTGRNRPDDQHTSELAAWLGLPVAVLRRQLGMPVYDVTATALAEAYVRGGEEAIGMLLDAAEKMLERYKMHRGDLRKSS